MYINKYNYNYIYLFLSVYLGIACFSIKLPTCSEGFIITAFIMSCSVNYLIIIENPRPAQEISLDCLHTQIPTKVHALFITSLIIIVLLEKCTTVTYRH